MKMEPNTKRDEKPLQPNRPLFVPITAEKNEWGTETFMNAGEALFEDIPIRE